MAKLVVLTEGLTGLSFELKAEKTTVGRVEDNAFQVTEASVSSHHCEVLQRGGDFLVRDLKSTNGTFVNGEQVTEAALKPGQILRLGQVEMRLETGAGGPAAKKPLDKTMVIPQGVKVQELDQASRPLVEANTAFIKKSNKTNLLFVVIGVVLGIVIVGCIIFAIWMMRRESGAPVP
jgi:pSer/pThr/pTyr-binding forkhead associated (FHA) protein